MVMVSKEKNKTQINEIELEKFITTLEANAIISNKKGNTKKVTLDTSAIDYIVKSNYIEKWITFGKANNIEWQYCDLQLREIEAVDEYKSCSGNLSYKKNQWATKQKDLLFKMKAVRQSSPAALYADYFLLDGSFHFVSENKDTRLMLDEIINNNPVQHQKDALIAESAIYNRSILLTNDKRLNKIVNKHFPNNSFLISKLFCYMNN